MGQLQQVVRFTTGHDRYNEGEIATFDRDEAERLISIGAAKPYTGPTQPTTEQEFIPAKKAQKGVKGLASTDLPGAVTRGAGQGAQPTGQMASVFPPFDPADETDPRSDKQRAARDKAAGETKGEDQVDAYDAVRREMYGAAYADGVAKHGLVDPEKEIALRRPVAAVGTVPFGPATTGQTKAQAKEAEKLEAARARAAKKAGSKKSKKAGSKKGGPTASQRGATAAAQGTGTGLQSGTKAANVARDTKTEMRNRGEGLGPASPKESGRNP
jgi:hypothetical protein